MATTLLTIRTSAKESADMSNSDFVSDAQWNTWINTAVLELHGIVTTAYADTYFKHADFTLTAASNVISLPADFGSIRGLDLNPDSANRQTVHKFNFGERNSLGRTTRGDRKYRVVSRSQLIIDPIENCAGVYRLFYTPRPTALTGDSSAIDIELDTWWEYVAIVAAMKALAKEESFEQVNELKERRNLMRADIMSSVNLDTAEQDSIIDVEGSSCWPYRQ